MIDAFRLMPSCPVFSVGPGRVRTAVGDRRTPMTDVLEWAAILRDDKPAQRYLWAWASCQATGVSFGAYCTGMGQGWNRSTAEAGRRRGADTIVAHFAAAEKPRPSTGLDSRKASPGLEQGLTEPALS